MADVLRAYTSAYLEAFADVTSAEQRRVPRDLVRCRTAALGGHVEACDECGHRVIAYDSCRNRHCPKCQASARAAWLDEQAQDLLDTGYFHVVFPLPDSLGPLALQNRRVVYGLLFRAAAQTLTQVAADPKPLGADIGFLAVRHAWGQKLLLHPHVHRVVTGGGLAPDGRRWVSCRQGFFLPVRVLSRVFRGKFLALLGAAYDRGKLTLHGQQSGLADPAVFRRRLDGMRGVGWVAYAKPPFGGPPQVLKYLARYVHRVAISNSRLVKVEDGQVYFRWKDYAHGNADKVMAVDAVEFIRRFLLHVLPSGFVQVRHYGFLANRCREEKLPLCRRLVAEAKAEAAQARTPEDAVGGATADATSEEEGPRESERQHACPACGRGKMVRVEICEPEGAREGDRLDTS